MKSIIKVSVMLGGMLLFCSLILSVMNNIVPSQDFIFLSFLLGGVGIALFLLGVMLHFK